MRRRSLSSMLEQLAAISGRDIGLVTSSGGRHGEYLILLDEASRAARLRGNTLVLLVDGLDEDKSHNRRSIASLLPINKVAGLRVVVTSRPDLSLPDDVEHRHPLRRVAVEQLVESASALDIGRRALSELQDRLRGPDLVVQILAFVVASGGGLSPSDLAQILNFAHNTRIPLAAIQLRQLLLGDLGRTTRIIVTDGIDEQVVFAHETLHAVAGEALRDVIHAYQNILDDWVSDLRLTRWPGAASMYAFSTYPKQLEASQRWHRLLELTLDVRRQTWLRKRYGSHHFLIAEHVRLLAHVTEQFPVDFTAIVRLTISYSLLAQVRRLPSSMPIAWARLGDFDKALLLARGVADYMAVNVAIELLELAQGHASDQAISTLRQEAETLIRSGAGSFPLRLDDAPNRKRLELIEVALAAHDLDTAVQIWTEIDSTSSTYSSASIRIIQVQARQNMPLALASVAALPLNIRLMVIKVVPRGKVTSGLRRHIPI